jgi:hypothetical protein
MPHPGLVSPVAPFLFVAPFAMSHIRSLLLLLAAVSGGVSASIGPGATLPIVNTNISPDGFTRA